MTARLAGKTAIVVGAGQTPGDTIGNGRAIALTFAREGAEVLCVDRLPERAEETAAMAMAEGGAAIAATADITKVGDIEALVAAALSRWGRIDILVNNVGVGAAGDGPAHRCTDDAFDQLFAINFTGARRLTRAVLAPMRAAET
jgi:NAD(P)-dependent dehydrogenase (short-subunit alcohol dehydrogenase family)